MFAEPGTPETISPERHSLLGVLCVPDCTCRLEALYYSTNLHPCARLLPSRFPALSPLNDLV
jgi:hypothetical protein